MANNDPYNLAQSNAVQQDRYREAPVVPYQAPYTPPPVAPAPQAPITSTETDASGAVVDTTPAVPGAGSELTAANYGPDVQGGNTISAPYAKQPSAAATAKPVIAPSATTPRVAAPDEYQSVQVPPKQNYRTVETGGGAAVPYDQAGTQAQLSGLNAKQRLDAASAEQDRRNGITNSMATSDRMQAGQDLLRAESEARVSRFRATDGADVILASGNSEYDGQRKKIFDAAKEDADTVTAARARANTPVIPAGNVLQDQVAVQDAANRGTQSGIAQQQGVIALSSEKQKLEQQQQIGKLGASLIAETDPAKRASLQDSLLTLLGKETGGRYKINVAPGQTVTDPQTMAQSKTPGYAVITDSHTGKTEIHALPDNEQPKTPQIAKGTTQVDKNGMKRTWDGSKWVNQ